ncbi:MAG: hypothetical protein MZU91_14910 [Desulfosudis oleivorans]|nr:hypothetical protein [Desulfosudis oleivorans]
MKGCPPEPKDLLKRSASGGDRRRIPSLVREDGSSCRVFLCRRYAGRPEFEEGHFTVPEQRADASSRQMLLRYQIHFSQHLTVHTLIPLSFC